MATYGVTSTTETIDSQLFAGDYKALKTISIASGEGACLRGQVLAMDATDKTYVKLDLVDPDQDEAYCVLVGAVDATSAAESAVVLMSGEVALADLVWPAGITDAQIITATNQLRAMGIIAK